MIPQAAMAISGGSGGGIKMGDLFGSGVGGNDKLGGNMGSMADVHIGAQGNPYAMPILESLGMGGSAARQAAAGANKFIPLVVVVFAGVGALVWLKKKK